LTVAWFSFALPVLEIDEEVEAEVEAGDWVVFFNLDNLQ